MSTALYTPNGPPVNRQDEEDENYEPGDLLLSDLPDENPETRLFDRLEAVGLPVACIEAYLERVIWQNNEKIYAAHREFYCQRCRRFVIGAPLPGGGGVLQNINPLACSCSLSAPALASLLAAQNNVWQALGMWEGRVIGALLTAGVSQGDAKDAAAALWPLSDAQRENLSHALQTHPDRQEALL